MARRSSGSRFALQEPRIALPPAEPINPADIQSFLADAGGKCPGDCIEFFGPNRIKVVIRLRAVFPDLDVTEPRAGIWLLPVIVVDLKSALGGRAHQPIEM